MSDAGAQTSKAMANSIEALAERAIGAQSALSEKLVEANRRWLEQVQIESNEVWELTRRVNSEIAFVEKVSAFQDWLRGVTQRGAKDAIYTLEVARTFGELLQTMTVPRPLFTLNEGLRRADADHA